MQETQLPLQEMTAQEFIDTCHAAQYDAGSKINFNEKVTYAVTRMSTGKQAIQDPVAAFIAALLISNNASVEKCVEDLQFYVSELSRIKTAFQLLTN